MTKQDLLKIKDVHVRRIISRSKCIATDDLARWKEEHFFLHFIGVLERPLELGSYVNPPPEPPIAKSKEEAFMMLSPKRFIIDGGFIIVPNGMTGREQKIIDLLCSQYGYSTTGAENGAK